MIPKNQLCQKCKKNKATIEYTEGVLAWSHGFVEYICEDCYDKMQKATPLYKQTRQQAFKDVEKVINEMPFIMCIKDAEGNDEVSKSWREQFVIRREELKKELEKVK